MTMQPRRVQRKRTKGWKMPPNTVYVGRPAKWGNPYRIGSIFPLNTLIKERTRKNMSAGYGQIEDSKILLAAYEQYIENRLRARDMGHDISELRGKNLCCWCPLDKPCHADLLLKLANG